MEFFENLISNTDSIPPKIYMNKRACGLAWLFHLKFLDSQLLHGSVSQNCVCSLSVAFHLLRSELLSIAGATFGMNSWVQQLHIYFSLEIFFISEYVKTQTYKVCILFSMLILTESWKRLELNNLTLFGKHLNVLGISVNPQVNKTFPSA